MIAVRKFHRYFALVLGVMFFIWIVSGVMMMLPEPTPGALVPREQPKADFTTVAVAPAELIRNFRNHRGAGVEINRIVLRAFRGRPVYEVWPRGEQASLWDPVSGALITITPRMAELIVRDHVREDVGAATIGRIEKHTIIYPWGPLPAYRLEFENGRGTIAYVSVANGSVTFTDWRKQLWFALAGLHEFAPLDILFGDSDVRRPVLMIVSLLTLIIVFTGYYMEFFTRSKRR